jgi:polyhydroxyalkanoate synthesis regulator phasin
MKKLLIVFFASAILSVAGGASITNAGEVESLIKKLEEKGILSATEAKDLIGEMEKENQKQQ